MLHLQPWGDPLVAATTFNWSLHDIKKSEQSSDNHHLSFTWLQGGHRPILTMNVCPSVI